MTRVFPISAFTEEDDRYGIHKESDKTIEVFMLCPKTQHNIDFIKENLCKFKQPNKQKINQVKRKHPNMPAMMKNCKSSDIKSYAKPGFIEYRNAVYCYHLYQFIRNDHSKIEITAVFNSKKRSKKSVMHELEQVIDRVTWGIPHVPYYEHSLGELSN